MEAGRARTQSGRSIMSQHDDTDMGSTSVGATNDPFAGFHNTVATVTMVSPSSVATLQRESTNMSSGSRTFSRTYSYTRTFSCEYTHRSSLQPPPPPVRPSFVRIRWQGGHVGEEFPREIQDRLTRQQFAERVSEINGIGRQYLQQRRHAARIAFVLAIVASSGTVAAVCIAVLVRLSATLVPLFIMVALFAFASPYFAYRALRAKRDMVEAVKARLVTFTIEDDVRGIKWQLFTAIEGSQKKKKQRYIEIDIIESTEQQEPIVFEVECEANEPQNDLPPAYEADASPPTYSQLRASARSPSADLDVLTIAQDVTF